MQMIQKNYRSLELLFELNLDRFFMLFALCAALFLAAYIGTP
jgi:hypothetical protein